MKGKTSIVPNLPERLGEMEDLAGNLWWSWHPEARMLFKMLDRPAWKESGHNPVKMLKELPVETFGTAAADSNYLSHYDAVISSFKKYMGAKESWFSGSVANAGSYTIAYFSAEYGLHHSLPFYAGGLGFLAGDFLKESSDLGVPLVAIGFMYPEGYVRQRIREDGWQESLDQILDRDAASVSRVTDDKGNQVIVEVPLTDPPIYVALWKIAVGRVPLYLLDTDIEMNDPSHRRMLEHLYIGDLEQRLRQEIVLGIGGSKALQALGIKHSVLHLNEGHAAFALLEKIRERVAGSVVFAEAAERVRASSLFTTHTPVPAGHDVFPFALIEKYFHSYWPALGLDRQAFLELGINPQDPRAGFNMTALALKLSGFRNGVSARHAEVTRQMWRGLWPSLPEDKVPIDHVTNGVHVPTWTEPKMALLFDKYLGPDWLERHDDPAVWSKIDEIPDEELWRSHYWFKIKLIDAIRERSRQAWATDNGSCSMALAGGALLDPAILTIGFARRIVTYKRADLIFTDLERLKRLLNDRWRSIQIIFAGKAHPADDPAKRILQRVIGLARDPGLGGRVAFVQDYGEQFAQYMVHGVDVWLNNPIPSLEASGTSGMKAALNGIPSLSILDGWWIEGFNGRNGWAFGQGDVKGNRDKADAEAIYEIIGKEVMPRYYRVSENGTPIEWVKMMKESIKSNAARFSARRMVKEYVRKYASSDPGSR